MAHASSRRRLSLGAVLSTVVLLGVPAAAFGAHRAAPASTPAPSALSAAQLPSGARALGELAPAAPLNVAVFLQPRDPRALSTFAEQVADRSSPQFGHYLGRGQFASRFGPAPATIELAEHYFEEEGLVVAGLAPNHLLLRLSGSAARFSAAFHAPLRAVRLSSGALGRVAVGSLRLPGGLANQVAAVVGLDQLSTAHALSGPMDLATRRSNARRGSFSTRPGDIPGAPSACPAALATVTTAGGITDAQVADAYGADGLYKDGDFASGQSIAIFELEPFATSDLRAFDECYFGQDHTSHVQVIPVDGGPGAGYGSGEATLDVETVSALAPDASLKVYEAPNTNYGLVDGYNAIVAADTSQVVSTSWGECEEESVSSDPGEVLAENVLFEQAAAQGQTVVAASGDEGNDDCHNPPGVRPLVSVDDPASQPFVVGVGGTTPVSVTQPPKEKVWNDGVTGGGSGGGISTLWTGMPWQRSAAQNKSNGALCGAPQGDLCRGVPDVSAFADEKSGITIFYGGAYGAWGTIGGTSIAAPMWAAMLAEINASRACKASPQTMHGVGFAAPLLYDVASNPTDYASGFTNVTIGNNDVLNDTGSRYSAGPGYSLAAGLGSPEVTAPPGATGPGLADSLCAEAQGRTTATVVSVHPAAGAVEGGTHFTIRGTGFTTAAGVPDVASVNFGTSTAAFTVASNTRIVGTTGPDTDTADPQLAKLNGRTGTVLVTVTTIDGSVARGPAYHYRARLRGRLVPTVLEVGPTGGRGAGGTRVTIYGSGFTGASRVTFGGVPSRTFTVLSDGQILAIAPPDRHVHCAVDDAPDLGLCQVEVVVTGPGGASTPAPILRPWDGTLDLNAIQEVLVPAGCRCEAYPSVSEYDYVTRLHLSGVVGPSGRAYEADPYGGDVLTLRGVGFNVLTLNWVNIGPPGSEWSQDPADVFYIGRGTTLQILSPGAPTPLDREFSAPVTLDTVDGFSNAKPLRFGPVQQVDSVSTEVVSGTGGQSLVLHGGGFVKVTKIIWDPGSLNTLEVDQTSGYTVNSANEITVTTPPLVPGSYQLYVCGVYGCGASGPNDNLASDVVSTNTVGSAIVTSADQVSGGSPYGSVAGGDVFEIQGVNFGDLSQLQVAFVNYQGEAVDTVPLSAGPPPTDPGATQTILVSAPAALDGYPALDFLVLSGTDGTSPVNIAASFTYTSP